MGVVVLVKFLKIRRNVFLTALITIYLMRTVQVTTKSTAYFLRYESLKSWTSELQFPTCERLLVTEWELLLVLNRGMQRSTDSKMWKFNYHKLPLLLLCLFFTLPSVLWRCWLGGRKGIRPVKNWVVECWCCCLSGAMCRLAYGPADATATHCLLLHENSRLVLLFWYRLTG